MFNDIRLFGQDEDIHELINELKSPWKTMNDDMDTALRIIGNCAQSETQIELRQLQFLEREPHRELTFRFPDWQAEIEQTFVQQYGLYTGKLVFNKVMMRLFQMSRGTEPQLH